MLLLRAVSATILTQSAHVIIKTSCQFKHSCTQGRVKYKGKMITVDTIDLDGGVCEVWDINSTFSTKNFRRFCKRLQNENNEQERKGRRGAEE